MNPYFVVPNVLRELSVVTVDSKQSFGVADEPEAEMISSGVSRFFAAAARHVS